MLCNEFPSRIDSVQPQFFGVPHQLGFSDLVMSKAVHMRFDTADMRLFMPVFTLISKVLPRLSLCISFRTFFLFGHGLFPLLTVVDSHRHFAPLRNFFTVYTPSITPLRL